MTSTVLDVTLLLLCVSASVVVLGGVGSNPLASETDAPDVERTADRLTTETATVQYHTTGGNRTMHATLAEHLVESMYTDAQPGDKNGPTVATRTRTTVEAAFGPRIRIDGHPQHSDGSDCRNSQLTDSESIDSPSLPGPGAPTLVRDFGSGIYGSSTSESELAPESITIGADPPRSATVRTAITTAPIPSHHSPSCDRVRFVVRVW